MLKYLQIAVGILLTSFYFFPLEFTFLPGVNTKMAMAAIGLVVLGIQLGRSRDSIFSKDAVTISLYALLVSFVSFAAVTLNETRDYGYVTYIISMWVWLSAAYVAVKYMRAVHGYISVELVCNYLIAVCVFQCVTALLIDSIPALYNIVTQNIASLGSTGIQHMANKGRLFGVGASLDPAGSRFAAVLVIVFVEALRIAKTDWNRSLIWHVLAFLLIVVAGNMIARTTIVGVIIASAYLVYLIGMSVGSGDNSSWRVFRTFIVVIALVIPVLAVLYHTNEQFYEHIRFGFEGFFSLAEKGRWEVSSNEILKNMVVFPDNMKTWLIGDGYMIDPTGIDPYYLGKSFNGYYMHTDIGYLRFLFYGGIPCALAMGLFVWQAGRICMQKFPSQKMLFILLVLVNYVVWLKGATDIFMVLAPFLVLGLQEYDAAEECEVISE